MANSVVKVTDAMLNDSLLLLVGEDGTVTPDRETVESYLNSKGGATNIQLMHINKTDNRGMDISVDHLTYIPDNVNEVEVNLPFNNKAPEVIGIERNLHNFRLDHDYTSFTSPPRYEEDSPQLEDLVETLGGENIESLNDGELNKITTQVLIEPTPSSEKTPQLEETEEMIKNKTTIITPIKGKAKFINTERKPVSKPIITKQSERAKVKEKPKIVQQIVDEFEDSYDQDFIKDDNDSIDDDNDSDFEIDELDKPKNIKGNKTNLQRKTKTILKVENRQMRSERSKSKDQKSKTPLKIQIQETTPDKSQDEKDKLTPTSTPNEKKLPKKEKKTPKPIPNDFMLFSTPDIIRRVGKDPQTPTTPESSINMPARINSENRSKSSSLERTSPNANRSNRSSLDSKSSEKSFTKQDVKAKDQRSSRKNSVDEKQKSMSVDSKKDNNKAVILQNISLSDNEQLAMDPMPTPEDIRSIIMTEDVKSYTTSSLPLIQTSEITSTEPVDQGISLDATSLDLDQSILDNISTDEISEDILYQVAQSLVGNPDLQNAIDKGLNEGNLILDPSIQAHIAPQIQNQTPIPNTSVNSEQKEQSSEITKKGTQIVRPDGRIVVIPPIERPTTRSRNRKQPEEPQQPKITIKPLDNEHVSGNELDSSGEEEEMQEDESEDDPNKLWCICNQPHNNRFMICCDTCEEWYHGKCVNITKAMGQQMEEEGREWICLFCKDPTLKRPQAAARRIRKASRTSIDSAGSSKKAEKTESSSSKMICIVCQKPARENSIYCSQNCILTHASGVERVVVFERSTGKMLTGNKAPTSANLEKWLKEHPTFEVYRSGGKIVTSKVPQKQSLTQSKLKLVKNEENVVSLEVRKKGMKIGVLKHLPKNPESPSTSKVENKSPLKQTAMKPDTIKTQKFYTKTVSPANKKFEIAPTKVVKPVTTPTTPNKPKLIQTTLKTTPSIQKEKAQPIKTPKARQAEQQTTPQSNPKHQENIRENVEKTLFEQLTNRLKIDGTLKLTEDEVKEISNEIESELHKCFGDTGQKYRNKYRSLIFNIKDIKNQTLWKRICEKSINAYQLVRLSPDDMASQELALWREREAKHSLDMIKKSELELLNCSRQYVLKTHKGEQVLDEEKPVDKIDNIEVIRTLTEDPTANSKSDGRDQKKNSKHGHRDRERKSSKDRSISKDHKKRRRSSSKERERSRRRSSSKDRSKKDKKRSRSRERHKKSSHKSSRHKKDILHISSTEKLDKKSKEILEQLVDNKIVPPLEDRLWKHVPQEDVVPGPESDSDHEPSSTVTIPTPPHSIEVDDQGSQTSENKTVVAKAPEPKEPEIERSLSPPLTRKQSGEIWRGTISMIDVAQISITAHEVSGDCSDLCDQLPPNLDIVGRISLETVWDYIGKMKCSNSKIISLVRLNAVNVVEKMPYLALYSYLSSRKRLGVVKSTSKTIKDFYILPLAPQKPIPQALLPINGPGFEESRPALLLGIIVRDKRKRLGEQSTSYPLERKRSKVITPPFTAEPSTVVEPPRSYTPPSTASTPPLPVSKDPRMKLVVPPPPPLENEDIDDGDEPYSPEDSDPENNMVLEHSFIESKPSESSIVPPFSYTTAIPGLDVGSPLPASPLEIQKQMEELNKKIEAQKSEINNISKNIVSASTEIGHSALANIALPSNLQQILDSIKTISTDADEPPSVTKSDDASLTIPLILPKSFSRPPPPLLNPQLDFTNNTIPLNLPTKIKRNNSPHASESPGLLSSLTEAELVKKAAEMLGETELTIPVKEKPKIQIPILVPPPLLDSNNKRLKLDLDRNFDIEPPIPGVDN